MDIPPYRRTILNIVKCYPKTILSDLDALSQDDTIRHPANFKRRTQRPRMPLLLHTPHAPDMICTGHLVYRTHPVPDTPCTGHTLYHTPGVLFQRSEGHMVSGSRSLGPRSKVQGPRPKVQGPRPKVQGQRSRSPRSRSPRSRSPMKQARRSEGLRLQS